MKHILKLHGIPTSIVSDRNPTFLSSFWQQLFTRLGTKLNISTAYHPQSYDQSERLNQSLKLSFVVYVQSAQRGGLSGWPWSSGGTIPRIILLSN